MDDFPNLPIKNYFDIRQEIKSGDILLCSGNAPFSNMIKQATHSVWSHVAFIVRLDFISRILVLESVESIGVRAVPLSSYVYNYNATGKGYDGRLMLARHQDLQQENIPKLSKTATDLLGYPYNTQEIIRIATRIGMSALGVNNTDKDATPQREFICSEYAYICFKSIGITIDYDPLGFIAPVDFARCPRVSGVGFIQTEVMHSSGVMEQQAVESVV